MRQDTADWLRGHIAAIRLLNMQVEAVLEHHCPPAVSELREVEFACNRAERAVTQFVERGKEQG